MLSLSAVVSALQGQTMFSLLMNLLAVTFGCLILRNIVVWTYRLTFHPLAKYPGPWLAKVSDLYGAWHNWMGRLHTETEVAHRKYGPVVRQGPNKLVFNSVSALYDIYQSRDGVQKAHGYATMVPAPGAFNVFTAIDKSIHRFKRKLLNGGFSDQTIRAFEPTMLHHIDIFVRRLMGSPSSSYTPSYHDDEKSDSGWGPPLNMTDHCRHLQYDVMGEFGFGQSFELQTKPDNRFLIEAVVATGHKAGVYVQYPRLQFLQLDKLFYRRGLKIREKYLNLMARLVRERMSVQKEEKGGGVKGKEDLFANLVDAKDPETGRGFTESELWAESRFLLIAGADTSSTGLTATFFYLTSNPVAYSRLASEIRTTFTSASEILTSPKLSSCSYLRAVIDETMRMSPPISGTLWREVLSGGLSLDGALVPEGIDVGVNPYAVHHNESLFPDSYTFRPERWLVSPSNPKENVDALRHAFSPFSLGSRGCAGKNMAYMELSNSLARTIWYCDFRRAPGGLGGVSAGMKGAREGQHREGEFQLEEHITCQHEGPYLQFKAREGMGEELRGRMKWVRFDV